MVLTTTTKLNEQQVLKAADALLKFVAKQKENVEDDEGKMQLFDHEETIHLYFTIYTKPEGKKPARKLRHTIIKKIRIKHSIYMDKDVCLICGHNDSERTNKMLQEIPVPQVKKVLNVKDLREKFCQYKDKKALCDAYDLFISQDNILTLLTHDLGRYFFDRRKQPVGMSFRGEFQKRIMKYLYCTYAIRPIGSQMSVKIGIDSFTPQQITDNVMMGIEQIVRLIPNGWNGVKKIGLKSLKSPYLVIYQALLPQKKAEVVAKEKANEKKNAKQTSDKQDKKMVTESSGDGDKKMNTDSSCDQEMATESNEKQAKKDEVDNKMVTESSN